jgi:ubiquinone/menaquinone biosynthesis C-methylase UbiE
LDNSNNIFNTLSKNTDKVKIELGCGPSKQSGYIGIDVLPLEGVDIVADFNQGLSFIPDNSVDEVFSSHLLEHITNLELLMSEIHRILKPNGFQYIIVPHFSNPHYYSDYTHKNFFGLYTFDYFGNGKSNLKRKVPQFYSNAKYEVISRKLRFGAQPFYFRNKIKAVFTHLFNINPFMQELYEGTFSKFVSCYELHVKIRPIK